MYLLSSHPESPEFPQWLPLSDCHEGRSGANKTHFSLCWSSKVLGPGCTGSISPWLALLEGVSHPYSTRKALECVTSAQTLKKANAFQTFPCPCFCILSVKRLPFKVHNLYQVLYCLISCLPQVQSRRKINNMCLLTVMNSANV